MPTVHGWRLGMAVFISSVKLVDLRGLLLLALLTCTVTLVSYQTPPFQVLTMETLTTVLFFPWVSFLFVPIGNWETFDVIQWLRALDALNTHNDVYRLSVAGGVTTALILPGSANAIGLWLHKWVNGKHTKWVSGGQAFAIKLRPTAERSATSKLLEPPFSIINGTDVDLSIPPRWRQMK